MNQLHLCPNCQGQKIVSKPPWVAGDQDSWTSSSTGTYPCPTCMGKGYIVTQYNIPTTYDYSRER